MAESKKPTGKKKAPAKKKPAAKKPAKKKATRPPGRPKTKPSPATAPLPKPDLPKPSHVANQPLHPTKGKSMTELIREQLHEAEKTLENKKASLNHMKKWDGETWRHYFRRRHLKRRQRANKARIVELFEKRLKAAIERKEDRKEEKDDAHGSNPFNAHGGSVVTFDGKSCVEWIAHDLYAARQHGWAGQLVSGYRSPEYSEQLCYGICGRPSCPGTCAGRSSNHCRTGDGQGAADITDYINGERILYQIGSRLHNSLPYDLVHMSASGN